MDRTENSKWFMGEVVWQTEYSTEVIASLEFAWAYMTDVAHWDDPPAQFHLDGPFANGACGTTEMPGQPSRSWRLRDIHPLASYTIEFLLERATLLFTWRFNGLPTGHTRLTQHIALQGENAASYLADIQQAFTATLAAGMNRIAAAIDQAYTKPGTKMESRSRSYELHQMRVLECAPEGKTIQNDRDAVELIAEAMEAGAHIVVIPVERFDHSFFRLRTRVAGEIVQKFVQYRRRLVIVGDISTYLAESSAFEAFVHEANRGEDIWFIPHRADLEKLLNRLAK